MRHFDAVIIGGGPAGAATAILLAEAGWSVAVIEQKAFPRRKVCGEYLSATNWPLLTRLGLNDAFHEAAGPPVTKTAIFAGQSKYAAPLPKPPCGQGFGRALSRERLDTLLLKRAAELEAVVFQPAKCIGLNTEAGGPTATLEFGEREASHTIRASIVIAAHGSWEKGDLPTQMPQRPLRAGDWLAFKVHFRDTGLSDGLMPLLTFPDGYGGMVHCDGGRVSLSFCIRRRRLALLERAGGVAAGEAALAHILENCRAAREVLEPASREGSWLSAGTIRPGIRPRRAGAAFVVGNAAGEAHPVVAEGISMALQGAWLLAETLKRHRADIHEPKVQTQLANRYSAAWRRAFAARIYAAAAIAHWASRPVAVKAVGPLLTAFPAMVTFGARLSGKSRVVVPATPVIPKSERCHA